MSRTNRASDRLLLAVDAGGTKTDAWLAVQPPDSRRIRIVGKGTAGSGNPRAEGFERALDQIQQAITAAHRAADRDRGATSACLCVAGAGRRAEQDRILEWAETLGLAQRIRLVDDAQPILAATQITESSWPTDLLEVQGSSDSGGGVALIAGTGSLAWAIDTQGRTARAGGWGYVCGDEGSGYRIACAALNAATRAADHRSGGSPALLDALCRASQTRDVGQLVEWIHQDPLPRRRVAGLAQVVFEVGDVDPVAEQIVLTAARELAELVAAAARQLQLTPARYRFGCSGGVLLHQPRVRAQLLHHLEDWGIAPSGLQLIPQAVAGGLVLAAGLEFFASAARDPA